MKTCTKCGVSKPLVDFKLQKRKSGRFPTSWCRECLNTKSRTFMREHAKKPEVKARVAARETIYNRTPKRLARHRERSKLYRATPAAKAQKKQYVANYLTLPGKREKVTARSVAWQQAHPERVREIQRTASKKPARQLQHRLQQGKRRAKMKGTVTAAEWTTLVTAYAERCAYCEKRRKLTVDHVIPIAHGGPHLLANIVPACRRCNFSKNDSTLDVALRRLKVEPVPFAARRAAALALVRSRLS